jgi:BatD DUF11 like domain
MKKLQIFILLLIFSNLTLLGQQVSFKASIDRNPVGLGEKFRVQFTLYNASGSNYQAPSFKGFTVVSGPNVQQGYSSSTGQHAQIGYVLRADKLGEFVISPAQVNADGKRMKTSPLGVKVIKDPTDARQQQEKEREKQYSKQAKEYINKNIYVRMTVNKREVYQGEAVTVTYKMYENMEVATQSAWETFPTFDGFWASEIEIKDPQVKAEVINNKRFKTQIIKKYILYPQKSGDLTISRVELETNARLQDPNKRRSRRSMFEDMFGRSNSKVFTFTTRSNSAKIKVKPLPSPLPDDYIGAVGDIKLKAWIDNPNTKVNEPVTLKIEVSGSGNLKLIDPMELKLPKDIETYDPKINDNLRISTSGYSGKRIFEYLLIPRHSGKYKIYPMGFSYFDLKAKKFVKLTTPEMEINVEKGEGGETGVSSITGVSKEDVEFIGKDIRFLEPAPSSFDKEDSLFFASGMFYTLIGLPGLAFVLFFVYRRKQEELNSNKYLAKNKKANKVAKQKLSLANQMLGKGDNERFYEALTAALWGYLGDKLSIDRSMMTKDLAVKKLSANGVDSDLIKDYMTILDRAEFARFAPSQSATAADDDYSQATNLITNLEGVLK